MHVDSNFNNEIFLNGVYCHLLHSFCKQGINQKFIHDIITGDVNQTVGWQCVVWGLLAVALMDRERKKYFCSEEWEVLMQHYDI